MRKTVTQIFEGLVTRNPLLVLSLGLCPALAVSTTLLSGVGMGLSTTAVLVCSNTAISLLNRFIPEKMRIVAYIVLIAGFVSVVDMLMAAYFTSLSGRLGIFIPLIVVNPLILSRAEAFASKNNAGRSAIDGLAAGLGFTLALCLLSMIREILGYGTLFSNGEPVGSPAFSGIVLIPPDAFPPILFFTLPMGGFLALGLVIALMRKLMGPKKAGV